MLQYNLLIKDTFEADTVSPRLGEMAALKRQQKISKKKWWGEEGYEEGSRYRSRRLKLSFTLKAGN